MSKAVPLASRLLPWYADHGRHDLPWRKTQDAYALYLAEIMLQQTRVETVIPYYHRFLARFPHWQSLAEAPLDDVLALWSGLGYYARARNAKRCAEQILAVHGGHFPVDLSAAMDLPGVGRSTAAAVLASAYGQQQAILDANARRVLFRYHGLEGLPRAAANEHRLWQLAVEETPPNAHVYNQAIQDLGALLCRSQQPQCGWCPLSDLCRGKDKPLQAGASRQARPQRLAVFLGLEDEQGRLLLERRPQKGIWGGLWALPWVEVSSLELSVECCDALLAKAAKEYGVQLQFQKLSKVYRHVFTHFDLQYVILWAGLRVLALGDAASARLISRADSQALGLPSPLRRLLDDGQRG